MTKDEQIAKLKEKNKKQRIIISELRKETTSKNMKIGNLEIELDRVKEKSMDNYDRLCKVEIHNGEIFQEGIDKQLEIQDLESGIIGLVKKLK